MRKIIGFSIACLLGLFVMTPLAQADMTKQAPKVGNFFKDCQRCPEMAVVPAGTYTMGTNSRYKYEIPAHPVTIAKPFAIGRYEVTFDEYTLCVEEGGCKEVPDDHKWGRGRRPVINITWQDAVTYTKWLSKKTGATYRLPSEAEWEYAAKAGTTTNFFWGDDAGVSLGNCRNCQSEWSKKSSAPVGSFQANPWGLYDMHGNIWEWQQDCWNTSYLDAPEDGSPRLTGDCRNRVMRSGSWYYFSKNMRSAWRFKNDARVKSYGIGLRVVKELP